MEQRVPALRIVDNPVPVRKAVGEMRFHQQKDIVFRFNLRDVEIARSFREANHPEHAARLVPHGTRNFVQREHLGRCGVLAVIRVVARKQFAEERENHHLDARLLRKERRLEQVQHVLARIVHDGASQAHRGILVRLHAEALLEQVSRSSRIAVRDKSFYIEVLRINFENGTQEAVEGGIV